MIQGWIHVEMIHVHLQNSVITLNSEVLCGAQVAENSQFLFISMQAP